MYTDVKYGLVFNKLTFPAMLLGFVLNTLFFGISGFMYSFAACLAGIAIYMPAGALGLVGMGDVKLMGAIGALGGSSFMLSVFLFTSAIGLPHAIAVQYLNYRKDAFMMMITSFTTGAFKNKTIHKENKHNNRYKFYLGADIFLATLIACFYSFQISW